MEIDAMFRDELLLIKLRGEMDEYASQQARKKCDRLIDEYAPSKAIVFDLSEIAFMDSAGIGFLIGRYKHASRLQIPVYVSNPNFTADRILNMSGIYSLIPKASGL